MYENDQAAIVGVLNLYGLAVDARQWDLFDEIFTEDIHGDFGPAGATWTDLGTMKRSLAEFCDTLDKHQHAMMGPVVHVEGNVAYAFTYGNWLLVREAAGGDPSWLGNGWYDDELVRTEHGWRIRSRIVRLLSWTGNPQVSEPTGDQHPAMATNAVHQFAAAGQIRLLEALARKSTSAS